VARLVKKKFPDAIKAFYLHDPSKPDKAPYGVLKGIYISLVEFIQGLTVGYMDYVISPSEYSSLLFKKKYPTFKGQNFIAPLLIPTKKFPPRITVSFFASWVARIKQPDMIRLLSW